MKKTLVITALLAAVIALAAAALLLALGALGGPEDPAVAPCRRPPTTLSRRLVVLDHRELGVHFTCNGAQLAGTLFVPLGRGPHPTVVWLHGSGDQPRLSYGPLVASFVHDGIAFFSYDKRAEVVDDVRVGFLGASAAGWIAPRATEQSGHVRFVAIASPGVLRHSIVARFEQEAGDGGRSPTAIAKEIPSWPRSGFDPAPSLERLDVPALWLFGGADRNIPAGTSAEALRRIEKRRGKDWTIVVFHGAGHGLFDSPPTDPRAAPLAEAWIRRQVGVRP